MRLQGDDEGRPMEITRAEPGERRALRFAGAFPADVVPAMRRRVRELVDPSGGPVDLDLSAVESMDGSTMAVLLELRGELARAGAEARITGARDGVSRLYELYESAAHRPSQAPPPAPESALEQIGRAVESFVEGVHAHLDYLGNLLDAARATLARPGNVNWGDVSRVMERAGADGLPIVVMITFLVGMVTAFQAIVQLRQFGADIFVADLVALSVTRELGPLMTAIIVAGRSGAAFSAELGTMSVSEEIDALRTLGLSPYGFLVYPRIAALVLVVPLLTLVGDLCGIAGGVFVSMLRLDITLPAYLTRTQQVLDLWDVGSGVLKSVVFGWSIALVACQRGLATRGGAAGVGRSTTSAVVASLFALVVIDALFSVIFNLYGV
jgi:phospholipid/cholesterol/gamma-HCH transport system permease protein